MKPRTHKRGKALPQGQPLGFKTQCIDCRRGSCFGCPFWKTKPPRIREFAASRGGWQEVRPATDSEIEVFGQLRKVWPIFDGFQVRAKP
jgi:hypothetical protein